MRAPADGRACCLRLVLSCLCCLSAANVPARFACCAICRRGVFCRRRLVLLISVFAGSETVGTEQETKKE